MAEEMTREEFAALLREERAAFLEQQLEEKRMWRRYDDALAAAGEEYLASAVKLLENLQSEMRSAGATHEEIMAEIDRVGKEIKAALKPTCYAAARRAMAPTAPVKLQ